MVLHLLTHVDPAGVGVLVGHESGDCPEDDGDHEEGEKDAEAYSLATVRFLKKKRGGITQILASQRNLVMVESFKYLHLKGTLS